MKKNDLVVFFNGVEKKVKDAVEEVLWFEKPPRSLELYEINLTHIFDQDCVEVRFTEDYGLVQTSNLFSFFSRLGITPETVTDNDCIIFGAEGDKGVLTICMDSKHFFEEED